MKGILGHLESFFSSLRMRVSGTRTMYIQPLLQPSIAIDNCHNSILAG